MRVEGNGLGRSAVARVPACHNYSNGASGTVKRLRNRRLSTVYGNIQMSHLLSPNDATPRSCDRSALLLTAMGCTVAAAAPRDRLPPC